jgi:hypothetical protein
MTSNSEHIDDHQYIGTVHLFYKEDEKWFFSKKMHAPDVVSNDSFGSGGFAMNEDYFVVGAPYRNTDFADDGAGAVYIFDRAIIAVSTDLYRTRATSKVESVVYPNPFSKEMVVTTTLEEHFNVRVQIYNILGQLVATLSRGTLPSGTHRFTWKPSTESAGLYFLRIEIGDQARFHTVAYTP